MRKLISVSVVVVLVLGTLLSTTVFAAEITQKQAESIALAKTGGGVVTESKLDYENGRKVYEIDIIKANSKYEMDVCVTDSKIYSYKVKTYKTSNANGKNEITQKQAETIALARTNGGTIVKCKLDFENGRKVYEFEIVNGNTKYEMDVCVTDSKIYSFKQKAIKNTGNTGVPQGTNEITMEQAKTIALGRTSGGTVTKCKLDYENGLKVYEIEIVNGNTKYEMDVCVTDSKIYSYKEKTISNTGSTQPSNGISMEKAKAIALAKSGGGVVTKCKLDYEHGKQVYEIEIKNGRMEYEMDIDATSGAIYDFEQEYDD